MRRIPIPLFGGWMRIALARDEFDAQHDRLSRLCDLYPNPARALGSYGMTSDFTTTDGEQHILVGLFGDHPDVACHEAVHAAQAVALLNAIDPLKEQEAFAHLVQWFFQQITAARTA